MADLIGIDETWGGVRNKLNGLTNRTPLVGLFGTSQAENNHSAGSFTSGVPGALQSPAPREDKSSLGFAIYLEMLSGGRIEIPRSLNWGVSSWNTTQLLAYLDQAVAAHVSAGAAAVILIALANDPPTDILFETTVANSIQIEEAFTSSGIKVIWLAEYPRGNSSFSAQRLTGSRLQDHMAARRWINARHNGRDVFSVDPWPALSVPGSTTGDLIAAMSHDGLHLSGPGSLRVAKALLPVVNQLFPPRNVLSVNNTDLYSANNPYGVVGLNPMMDGTGGFVDGGNTGSMATSWGQGGTPSGVSAVLSKVTAADGYPAQRFVLSGTATGDNTWELLRQDVSVGSFGLAVDKVVKLKGEISVAAGATGVRAIWLSLGSGATLSSPSISARAPAPNGTILLSMLPTEEAVSGPVVLPEITVPSGAAGVRISLFASLVSGAAVSAQIDVKRLGVEMLNP